MNAAALFFVTHGSSDRRSWSTLQTLVNVARSQSSSPHVKNSPLISGGCLEGLELSLAQQLEQFAIEVSTYGCKEVIILPLFLLAGVHVSEDIPHEVAIAQSKLQFALSQDSNKSLEPITFQITPHLGTHPQIPSLLSQHFAKYANESSSETQGQILMAHGSRRTGANQVVEDLAQQSQAIAAYWGVEPKIETQIENLIVQNIYKINVLPYFLTSGGITEAIANKLSVYSDRAKIQLLPVPLSNEEIINLSLTFI
ncbi:sirohydrochlorin chelatase [Pseudanabaena sp. FACHB-1998]|uniref:sirohydrochlorin chelatase n=1 Tax=Pseudanabaena sp. FACHB-1998 TaxID=2692858 RepID=UPI00168079A0|nr:sirohydrochlorin chelatase [Pseudanabaena sp. FACHB-1998]MBD2176388.1 sirohydrochlorin chelatase [Pseudanabaena sp. FACHB-1998]